MTNRKLTAGLMAACVVGGALAGAAGAMVGVAGATRPYWSYHNGNTLLGQKAEYRRGYFIGVVDGYLHAHFRLTRRPDDGRWLDRCITQGWTANYTVAVLDHHWQGAVMQMKNPAAEIALDGLEKACAAGK